MGRNRQIVQKIDRVTAELVRAVSNSDTQLYILPNESTVNNARSLISQMKEGMWQLKCWQVSDSKEWLVQIKRMG